jgi:hypothetical protein
MSHQLFKKNVPNDILFSLLNTLCIKNEKYYIFDINSFKKGVFNNDIKAFIEECKSYYHNSKQMYLTRKVTYNNFITILRQICNFNNISYTSQLKYDKSSYNILYYIYF